MKPIGGRFVLRTVNGYDTVTEDLLSLGSICAFANVAPELFVNLVRSARDDDLETVAELHRRVLSLVILGMYSDPAISSIKLAMKMLGVPISPAVRGPALPVPEEAHEKVEGMLRDVVLLTVREAN